VTQSRAALTLCSIAALALAPRPADAERRIPQVLVGARIAQVTSSTGGELGINYGTKFGFEVGADVKIPVGNVGKNVSVSFRPGAVLSTGGGTIEIPATGSTPGTTTRITETVSLTSIDVPLLLEFKPQTLLDGRIRLLAGPQVSTLVGAKSVIGNRSTDLLQDVNRVSVPIVIGGLVTIGDKADVGLLGEISFIGHLFKQGGDEKGRSLAIIIRPHILGSGE